MTTPTESETVQDSEAMPNHAAQMCSFCGAARSTVLAMVTGPGVTMCSACWCSAAEVLASHFRTTPDATYLAVQRADADRRAERLRALIDFAGVEDGEIIQIGTDHQTAEESTE